MKDLIFFICLLNSVAIGYSLCFKSKFDLEIDRLKKAPFNSGEGAINSLLDRQNNFRLFSRKYRIRLWHISLMIQFLLIYVFLHLH